MNKIQRIGIVGSGKMGSDIFNYFSDFPFELVWYTRNADHTVVLRETFEKKIKRQLKHGIINQDIFELKNKYRITHLLSDLSNCDLIIESVIEDQLIKTEIFNKLEKLIKPSCIITSNSSSILPSKYSQDLIKKNRIAGLHFFYPLAFKNITEVVYSHETDELTKESIRLFLDSTNRFYIEQEEKDAFILNRFLLEIQIKAFELKAKYHLSYEQIDELAKKIIPDFGLFEMMDMVGHTTMYNSVLNYSLMESDKSRFKPLLNELSKKLESNKLSVNTFYNSEFSNKIEENLNKEAYTILKQYSQEMFDLYSQRFVINIYPFKKALEEFCGIIL